jgi:predicted N-acetyltransferase YhbS
VEIRCTTESRITPELDRQILQLQHEAFPDEPLFAVQRWWMVPACPQDLWFTASLDGRLVGSVRRLPRTVGAACGALVVAGIANVCSSPAARGRGAAKACMQAAQDGIASGWQADFGLLFCRGRVADFYSKLGWNDVTNPFIVTGPDGTKAPLPQRRAMIFAGRRRLADWPAGAIDLNGPRW